VPRERRPGWQAGDRPGIRRAHGLCRTRRAGTRRSLTDHPEHRAVRGIPRCARDDRRCARDDRRFARDDRRCARDDGPEPSGARRSLTSHPEDRTVRGIPRFARDDRP
jgi:hypothetical protein